jgi:hypothetical protein
MAVPSLLDSLYPQRHVGLWTGHNMQIETNSSAFANRLKLDAEIDGWRVSWMGGWGKDRLFYFVMVTRVKDQD